MSFIPEDTMALYYHTELEFHLVFPQSSQIPFHLVPSSWSSNIFQSSSFYMSMSSATRKGGDRVEGNTSLPEKRIIPQILCFCVKSWRFVKGQWMENIFM